MKCPHCLDSIYAKEQQRLIGIDRDGQLGFETYNCPSCERLFVYLCWGKSWGNGKMNEISKKQLVYPKDSSRPPCPSEVPLDVAEDYTEACIVLSDSPKASAALSRRCLQNLLREKAGIKHSSLANEIQQVIDKGELPSYLVDSIDAIRNIGNFSAHPNKSKNTGEIVNVEPQEAEWTLDVLESLFDFYFIQPTILKAKRDALNEKLTNIGKPPMK